MSNKIWAIALMFCSCLLVINSYLGKDIKVETKGESVVIDAQTENLKKILLNFRSNDIKVRKKAQDEILELSSKSPNFRQSAIQELVLIVKSQKKTYITCKDNCYKEWSLAVETLGLMKASEAIDSLIDHLEFNDGLSGFSLNRYPAGLALVNVGNSAIPSITKAFDNEENQQKRYLMVHILYSIRSDESKAALISLIKKVKNQNEREDITFFLKNW